MVQNSTQNINYPQNEMFKVFSSAKDMFVKYHTGPGTDCQVRCSLHVYIDRGKVQRNQNSSLCLV